MQVYDDFAHHPTAIATTLQGLRAQVGRERITAVLEPRSNTMKMGVHNDTLRPSLAEAVRALEVGALGYLAKPLAPAAGEEEAPTFGAPVLVLRDVTERPEGVDAGVAELVGTDPDRILTAAEAALASPSGVRPGVVHSVLLRQLFKWPLTWILGVPMTFLLGMVQGGAFSYSGDADFARYFNLWITVYMLIAFVGHFIACQRLIRRTGQHLTGIVKR